MVAGVISENIASEKSQFFVQFYARFDCSPLLCAINIVT